MRAVNGNAILRLEDEKQTGKLMYGRLTLKRAVVVSSAIAQPDEYDEIDEGDIVCVNEADLVAMQDGLFLVKKADIMLVYGNVNDKEEDEENA